GRSGWIAAICDAWPSASACAPRVRRGLRPAWRRQGACDVGGPGQALPCRRAGAVAHGRRRDAGAWRRGPMGRECARCTGVLPDGKPTQENIMTEEASQQAPAAPAPLPPFYRNPVPIDANRHAKAGLRPRTDVNFARDTNAIVLTVSEFAVAAR